MLIGLDWLHTVAEDLAFDLGDSLAWISWKRGRSLGANKIVVGVDRTYLELHFGLRRSGMTGRKSLAVVLLMDQGQVVARSFGEDLLRLELRSRVGERIVHNVVVGCTAMPPEVVEGVALREVAEVVQQEEGEGEKLVAAAGVEIAFE